MTFSHVFFHVPMLFQLDFPTFHIQHQKTSTSAGHRQLRASAGGLERGTGHTFQTQRGPVVHLDAGSGSIWLYDWIIQLQ